MRHFISEISAADLRHISSVQMNDVITFVDRDENLVQARKRNRREKGRNARANSATVEKQDFHRAARRSGHANVDRANFHI